MTELEKAFRKHYGIAVWPSLNISEAAVFKDWQACYAAIMEYARGKAYEVNDIEGNCNVVIGLSDLEAFGKEGE